MMIEQIYSLDLVPSGNPLVVYASQYDSKSRRLRFNLYKSGVAFTMPAGATAMIVGTKKDLTGFNYLMNVDGSAVYIDIEDQMTAVAGPVTCEVRITDANNERIGSSNFVLYIEKAAFDADTVISETDIPVFEELVARASSAAAEAQGAVESVSGVTAQVAANTANISTLTTNLGNATTNITVLQNLMNGWKIYAPDAFDTTTDIGQVIYSMQNKSIWFHNVNAATEFGGLPSVGILGVIKVNSARNIVFLKYVTAGNPNGKMWIASYEQNTQTLGTWRQAMFADDIIGSNLTGFTAAVSAGGNPCIRWIGDNNHYYQVLFYPADGTYSYQEYTNGSWKTLVRPIEANSLKNVRCLLIGNSYARGTGGDASSTWTNISGSEKAGHGWPYYFYLRTGCVPKVISQSGGDFVAVGNDNSDYPNKTYLQALTEVTNSMTEIERGAVRYIIVGGGYNDVCKTDTQVAVSQITSAISSFVSYCKTNYPNARIWIIPLLQASGYTNVYFYKKVKAYIDAALQAGVCTSQRSGDWFLNTSGYSSSDGVHLNDAGYQLAGAYIAALVQGWDGTLTLKENPARVIYNAGGITMVRSGTEITCTFNNVVVLPAVADVDAVVGGPWKPRNPNTQFLALWDYMNARIVYITMSLASGFQQVRTLDKEILIGDEKNPVYRLYGTLTWRTDLA